MKRIEKRLEMTWDLRSSKFEAEYFRKKVSESRTLRRSSLLQIALEILTQATKKEFLSCVRYLGSSPSTCCFKKTQLDSYPQWQNARIQTRKTLAAQPIAFAHLRALSRHVQTPNPTKIKPGSWSHGHSAKLSFCAEKRTDWISKICIIFNKRRLWALIIC